MKRIYVVGVEGTGSGMWDWFPEQERFEPMYQERIKDFSEFEGEIIYKGEMDVPDNLSQEETTTYVEGFLMEHGYEAAPLINRVIWNQRETFQSPYEQYKEHVGKKFELLRVADTDEHDAEEVGTMYKIRLETGEEITAWPEEIFKNVSSFEPDEA